MRFGYGSTRLRFASVQIGISLSLNCITSIAKDERMLSRMLGIPEDHSRSESFDVAEILRIGSDNLPGLHVLSK